VSAAATPTVRSAEAPTAYDDIVWFDPLLTVRGLKLKMLQAKGFDTTAVMQDYMNTLELVKGHDAPSPVLNLNRPSLGFREPLIGNQSVPITGYGN
jgi:hypothetical protein